MGQHDKYRALVAAALALTAGPASACRLALVLAMDVSASVDPSEDALQRGGLAAALIAPEVQAAFLSGDDPVALAAFEWSGRYNQQILLGWTLIATPADLAAASATIAASRRSHADFPTAIGYALGYAATLLAHGPDCAARTVDVAGDGINNEGFEPALAYREFSFDGVTVNGLVVDTVHADPEVDLVTYYLANLRHGVGAFVEIAETFADYEDAMRRKLLRELSGPLIGGVTRDNGSAG
jgi:hypothetical protein